MGIRRNVGQQAEGSVISKFHLYQGPLPQIHAQTHAVCKGGPDKCACPTLVCSIGTQRKPPPGPLSPTLVLTWPVRRNGTPAPAFLRTPAKSESASAPPQQVQLRGWLPGNSTSHSRSQPRQNCMSVAIRYVPLCENSALLDPNVTVALTAIEVSQGSRYVISMR